MSEKTNIILSETEIKNSIIRISHEIIEKVDIKNLVIIGIRNRGEFIAKRISHNIKIFSKNFFYKRK